MKGTCKQMNKGDAVRAQDRQGNREKILSAWLK
jgi:hypothetical protein